MPHWSGLLGGRPQGSTECVDVCVEGREAEDSTGMQMHRDEEATGYDVMAVSCVFLLMYVETPLTCLKFCFEHKLTLNGGNWFSGVLLGFH